MNPDVLAQFRDQLWLFVAGPALGLCALVLTVRLKAPQFRLLREGFRKLRTRLPKDADPEHVAPGLALVLETVGSFGAAAVVGTATAVTLGGAGVLPYVLLFAIFLAPLRYAEVWLARTAAPGKAAKKTGGGKGSLATRVGATSERYRMVGYLLFVPVLVAGFAWAGGTQGEALHSVVERLLPGSGLALVGGAAAVGAVLHLAGAKLRGLGAWVGVVGLVVMLIAGVWGCLADPGAAFGALTRSFGDMIEGSSQLDDFTGAFAGEVAAAAVLYALPPMSATSGVGGAMSSLGGGKTRTQASLAVLGTLFYGVIAVVLVMAFVGSGALGTRTADHRSIHDVRIMTVPIESASQRAELDRRYSGLMRIIDGNPRNPNLSIATDRGMIRDPSFSLDGAPADVALRLDVGQATNIMTPGRFGALTEGDASILRSVQVGGEMLPDGSGLVVQSLAAGHSLAPRVGLAGLLALVAVAFAAWGFALSRSVPVPKQAQLVIGVVPALGAGLAATGLVPWLAPLGGVAIGILAVAVSLILILRAKEVAQLSE